MTDKTKGKGKEQGKGTPEECKGLKGEEQKRCLKFVEKGKKAKAKMPKKE